MRKIKRVIFFTHYSFKYFTVALFFFKDVVIIHFLFLGIS